jgi:hypothetical protein
MSIYPPVSKPNRNTKEKNENNSSTSNTPSNQSPPPVPPQLGNPPPHAAIRALLVLMLLLLLLALLPLRDGDASITIGHLHLPAPRFVRPRIRLEAPAHRLDDELIEAPARREVGVLCEGVGKTGEDVFLSGCTGEGVLAGDGSATWWRRMQLMVMRGEGVRAVGDVNAPRVRR